MSVTIQFTLTNAGIAAAFNAQSTGIILDLTHIQLGSGNRTPDKTEVALVTPQQLSAIPAGYSISANQKRMTAIFGGVSAYNINEIGIWAGDPAAGGILFGYWSQATGSLSVKSSGVDFVFSHDLFLDGSFPGASISIVVSGTHPPESFTQVQADLLYENINAVAAHEALPDPHPQYLTPAEGAAAYDALGGLSSHVASADPHPQYLLDAQYTAADVLAKIKTVDGSGSGIDADTMDTLNSDQFLRSDAATTHNNGLQPNIASITGYNGQLNIRNGANPSASAIITFERANSHALALGLDTDNRLKFGGWSEGTNAYLIWSDKEGGKSLSGNGYQKLPSGLIIQWGRSNGVSNNTTITFPIAFPVSVFSLTTSESNEGGQQIYTAYDSLSNTGFISRGLDSVAHVGAIHSPSWIAIGY